MAWREASLRVDTPALIETMILIGIRNKHKGANVPYHEANRVFSSLGGHVLV